MSVSPRVSRPPFVLGRIRHFSLPCSYVSVLKRLRYGTTNCNVRLGATGIRIPRDISTCRRFLPDQFRAESDVHVYPTDSLESK